VPIWKITPKGPVKVTETKLQQEKLLEDNLEDWVVRDPSLLGEPLLIVDRQVRIPELNDRLDVLVVDSQGNAVIVELKRDKLTNPVDIQATVRSSFSLEKGEFDNAELERRLSATLARQSDLTPRLVRFLEILLGITKPGQIRQLLTNYPCDAHTDKIGFRRNPIPLGAAERIRALAPGSPECWR
jgi:hypothetical protein